MSDFPDIAPPRALWVVTLADLALLLVGFLLLVQVSGDRAALAKGLREGFGETPAAAMPVLATATPEFAAGSATLPRDLALVAWARDAVRDPRVMLTITGAVDGTPDDIDPATGSGAVLAADRARAVASLLAGAVPAGRLTIATTIAPGRRAAALTLAFAGERKP
ncbi:flagellar motor protein MotB [Sphingomonas sp.]|uniref:flagellar motor protein MotB n=1 Tax=Sphingomonas sp. TaxID=28214 RepID=UPI0035BC383B